ncbi:DNA sulfur modification protein DndD [Pedobacter suwonensis]|uniref:DNA sulfur modification protein DndD n=1 Tax=Pedobacter suwonensis TaxID=332999 RepID=A0A1I0U5U0_9SPHI|nr:AAA family ATPase [Pedobacter suwonensis]SFA58576.1 DNA sulfur modification protein DndD [Pedobacter suwonensis]
MLIDNITLKNFRAYQGKQPITLSTNPEKHVTIISGQNGFGKTSLLTSLVWILYGKLMVDVDERYRKEVYESGGYHRYAFKLMNRNALQEAVEQENVLKAERASTQNRLELARIDAEIDALYSFSGKLVLTNIFIPHLSCNEVSIARTYNTRKEREELEILIDGRANELTKTIGQDIFINDFILPKEIAKFFFFDAEKITALAEVKNIDEKLYFSKAYNEVLGIKKYTDLKQNLENLQLRISKKSASKGDLKKIDELQTRLHQLQELSVLHKEELEKKEQEQLIKAAELSKAQEELVRKGSAMSDQELNDYRKMRTNLREAMAKNKSDFNELLELAPFAMLMGKMQQVKDQIAVEERQQHTHLLNSLLKEKYSELKSAFALLKEVNQKEIEQILQTHLQAETNKETNILLAFTPDQTSLFNNIYANLQNAYAKQFKALVAEGKRLQSSFNITDKKLRDADIKAIDPVIKVIKSNYNELNTALAKLNEKIGYLKAELSTSEKEVASIQRQLSEQTKHIKVERQDQEKSATTQRLIQQLETFLLQLKLKKKASLEKNIKKELNSLMHKQAFVEHVEVKIEGDLIDIDLFDINGNIINKEGLSKGEQQLYATALLKALVTESNIQFPVFIDSPLQKLDKKHAANIIKEFYPSVSTQVVLFPLLEKELSEEEYELLLPKIGKAYLIRQEANYASTFADLYPKDLFSQFNQSLKAYV